MYFISKSTNNAKVDFRDRCSPGNISLNITYTKTEKKTVFFPSKDADRSI